VTAFAGVKKGAQKSDRTVMRYPGRKGGTPRSKSKPAVKKQGVSMFQHNGYRKPLCETVTKRRPKTEQAKEGMNCMLLTEALWSWMGESTIYR